MHMINNISAKHNYCPLRVATLTAFGAGPEVHEGLVPHTPYKEMPFLDQATTFNTYSL